MKQSPQNKDLHTNFYPSKYSGNGFLGEDNRTIDEIISADRQILNKYNLSAESIADYLTVIYEKAAVSQGQKVQIGDNKYAQYYESRGSIPCPFRGHGQFEKGEVNLTDETGKDRTIITRLGIHLIKEHTFFQGKGSRFRIDPEKIVKIMELSL